MLAVVAIALLAVLADVGRAAPRPDMGEDIGAAAVGAMTLAMTAIDAIGQGGAVRSKSNTQFDIADQKFGDTRDMEAGVGKAIQSGDGERRKRALKPYDGSDAGRPPPGGGRVEVAATNGDSIKPRMAQNRKRTRREIRAENEVGMVNQNGDGERKKRAAMPCGGGGGGRRGGGGGSGGGGGGGGGDGGGETGGGDVEDVETNGEQRSQRQQQGRKRGRREAREYTKTAAAVDKQLIRAEREVGVKVTQNGDGERKKRAAMPCGGGGGRRGGGGGSGGGGGDGGGGGETGGGDVEDVDTNGEQRSQKQRQGRKRTRRQAQDGSQFTEELSSSLQRFVDSARRLAARVHELFQSAQADGGSPSDGNFSEVEQMQV